MFAIIRETSDFDELGFYIKSISRLKFTYYGYVVFTVDPQLLHDAQPVPFVVASLFRWNYFSSRLERLDLKDHWPHLYHNGIYLGVTLQVVIDALRGTS